MRVWQDYRQLCHLYQARAFNARCKFILKFTNNSRDTTPMSWRVLYCYMVSRRKNEFAFGTEDAPICISLFNKVPSSMLTASLSKALTCTQMYRSSVLRCNIAAFIDISICWFELSILKKRCRRMLLIHVQCGRNSVTNFGPAPSSTRHLTGVIP